MVALAAQAAVLQSRIAGIIWLIAVDLLASLLPPTDFSIGSTPDPNPATNLSPVYAGHGVQQSLGLLQNPVVEAKIWVAAGPKGDPVRVSASLVTGDQSRQLTQTSFEALPSSRAVPREIRFRPYDPPDGGETRIQLVVAENAENFASFGVVSFDPGEGADFIAPTLNGVPQDFLGPLAHQLRGHGSGFHAAYYGAGAERLRLFGSIAAIVTALLIRVAGTRILRLALSIPSLRDEPGTGARRRGLFFYAWLVVLYPSLYFFSNNVFLFDIEELTLIVGITVGVATVLMLAAVLVFRNGAVAASTTSVVAVLFLVYGHMYDALGDAGDHGYLLPATLILAIIVVWFFAKLPKRMHRIGRFLNYASIPLVAIPIVSLGLSLGAAPDLDSFRAEALKADSVPADVTRPDIYYIILDEYGRADTFEGFDNTPFLQSLAERGFYIATEASSNYATTAASIPSTLNLDYLPDVGTWGPEDYGMAQELADDHALGRIVEALGYQNIHVASGYWVTNLSRNAHLLVDFAPSGTLTTEQVSFRPGIFNFDKFRFGRLTRAAFHDRSKGLYWQRRKPSIRFPLPAMASGADFANL